MAEALRVEMWLGDCLEVMPRLPVRASMIFCDLPYGITGHTWDCTISLSKLWSILQTCGSDGVVSAFTATNPFASLLVTSNIKQFRYDIVWRKNASSGFLQAKTRPLRAHEHVLIFAKSKHTYNPRMTAGEMYKHQSVTAGRKTYRTKNFLNRIDETTTRHPTSVQNFGVARYTDGRHHPTQKPVALLEWLVETYSNPSDTVLDPCAGSFTTAIACLRTGRNFVGIELDGGYFAAGVERVKAEIAASGVDADLVVHG